MTIESTRTHHKEIEDFEKIKNYPPEKKLNNWRKQLRQEFGIHFKNSPDELQFLEAFIEDLLEEQKEKIKYRDLYCNF